MDRDNNIAALRIRGGQVVSGEVMISGAKNAALPMMAASLLSSSPSRLSNLPALSDVSVMEDLLKLLGGEY